MPNTPRTLPPWVQTASDDDLSDLPNTPDNARLATPVLRGANPRPEAPRGRKLDHARSAEPVMLSTPAIENTARWTEFMNTTTAPSRPSTGRTVVDDEWMKKNWPYKFDEPWKPLEAADTLQKDTRFFLFSPEKRKKFVKRLYRQLMNNPFVPLLFRLTVLAFSCLALGLAGGLFRGTSHSQGASTDESTTPGPCRRLSSTFMAIAFDTVAIIYVLYITWDEYTSEPLGLRSHSAKMRLIFLDLIFIVFNSANLALAFEPLFDSTWACQPTDPRTHPSRACAQSASLCDKQKALSGTLVVALVAWLATFAISTLRIVERAVVREKAYRS